MLELSAGGAHGLRLSPAPPPTTPRAESGKLDPSDTADQMSEGDKLMVQSPIHVSPVTGGYRLPGWINGTKLSLLLDTGAAVALLREDVWRQLAPQPPGLEPWPGATLVSAGGMPLNVHGSVCVNLDLGGREFKAEMVVVSPLTSEAILGIDFLQGQQAVIDLGRRRLHLKESGCELVLDAPP